MPENRNLQFTAHLPPSLAARVNLCARYTGKSADTIVSDLVAACMEDLPTVENEGAEGVEKLLQLLQAANVEGYEKAVALVHDIVERETMGAVVEAREAQGLERLPSQRSENEQRRAASPLAVAFGAFDQPKE